VSGAAAAPATGRHPRRAIAGVLDLVPVALVIVAEAAWISVFGGLVQEVALRQPEVSLPLLAAIVTAGALAARFFGGRLRDRWPIVGLGLVIGAGALGWLGSDAARSSLGAGIGQSLAAHPGGWMVGLALLRGFAHARLPLPEGTVSRLLAIGVPGLALAALVGGVIGEPYRTRFLDDTLGASIVFVATTVLALAFARLGAIGQNGGVDWRRNPTWLLLTIGLLAAAIALALPLSLVVGTAISILIGISLGPALVIGLAMGFDRTFRRILLFFLVVPVVAYLIGSTINRFMRPSPVTPIGPGVDVEPSAAAQFVTISIGGLILLAAILGVLLLITVWMRRSRAVDDDVAETRSTDRGDEATVTPRRASRFRRRPAPGDAVAAYVALLTDLDSHPDVRRSPAETPAEHSARLRDEGRAELPLDLLAADYALARYGGVVLSGREDRRAIGRWRVLRRRLTHPPATRWG
jgi:hypothetical protein